MKQCTTCGETKDESEFHKNKRWPDGLQKYCKECHKAINKNHYESNKDEYIARSKKAGDDRREWWRNYKQTLTCSMCDESRWWCLDFHHTDPEAKDLALSAMVSKSKSREQIMEEVSKCVVVCRNCHADIHYQKSMGR